jgi:hypothetical protein
VTNGEFKRDTVGWTKKAKAQLHRLSEQAEEKTTEQLIGKKAVEYLGVYANLGAAAMSASKIIKEYLEDLAAVYEDSKKSESDEDEPQERLFDTRELKAAVDAGLSAHALLKKIYTGSDLQISEEIQYKIEDPPVLHFI